MVKRRTGKQGSEQIPAEDRELHRTLLWKIEDDWLTARLRGETESTERLLDETYQGGTSDGLAQTKADFVRSVKSSRAFYTDGSQTGRSIQLHGDTAVSTGLATLQTENQRYAFRYLRVFRRSEGEWRLIASQSAGLRTA
jgi:hypothetical protein